MKREMMVLVGVAVAFTVGVSGCQMKKYEKVILETEAAETVTSGQTAATAQNQVPEVGAPGGVPQGQEAMAVVSQEPPGKGGAGETTVLEKSEAALADPLDWEERDEIVYVNTDQLNVRKSPQDDGKVMVVLNTGAELKRTGFNSKSKWSRVEYQGTVCYVAAQYLTTTKPEGSRGPAVSGEAEEISLDGGWKYAENSKIHTGTALLYRSAAWNRRDKTVCINAGHGTSGGESVKTLCHPDGTPKVTGGSTGAGATRATAVSSGMVFADGTPERNVTLALALALKEKLLARGYDVLMIRESDDVQLDNIARTVIANNRADCHLALHWDSTTNDKGAFYMSVPNIASYRSMEPVASHWQEHHALGNSLIAGLRNAGVGIFSGGSLDMDLTQTSYSTIPSVDIELGDKASDHSAATMEQLAKGLAEGIDQFFGN